MTSKQRAYLKGLAMTIDPIFQVGKSSLTPENTEAIGEAFNTRELIKIAVLKNCMDDPREIAEMVAGRTQSEVVQIIKKKIVLKKENKDNKKDWSDEQQSARAGCFFVFMLRGCRPLALLRFKHYTVIIPLY